MVDGDFFNGNQQVVDFVAARAAKPAKLTAALFETAGISVAARPPSDSAP